MIALIIIAIGSFSAGMFAGILLMCLLAIAGREERILEQKGF